MRAWIAPRSMEIIIRVVHLTQPVNGQTMTISVITNDALSFYIQNRGGGALPKSPIYTKAFSL
jgi:hypothetical protein